MSVLYDCDGVKFVSDSCYSVSMKVKNPEELSCFNELVKKFCSKSMQDKYKAAIEAKNGVPYLMDVVVSKIRYLSLREDEIRVAVKVPGSADYQVIQQLGESDLGKSVLSAAELEEFAQVAKEALDEATENHSIGGTKEAFEFAKIGFQADNDVLIKILKQVDGVSLEQHGRSGFASRNTIKINALNDVKQPDLTDVARQKILSRAVFEWAVDQLKLIRESNFRAAVRENYVKGGPVCVVRIGGNESKKDIPEDVEDKFIKVFDIRVANTQDYRQNLTHTNDVIMINKAKVASRINNHGILDLDIPSSGEKSHDPYVGRFYGKAGANRQALLEELQKDFPNLKDIRIHIHPFSYHAPVEKIPSYDGITAGDIAYANEIALFKKNNPEIAKGLGHVIVPSDSRGVIFSVELKEGKRIDEFRKRVCSEMGFDPSVLGPELRFYSYPTGKWEDVVRESVAYELEDLGLLESEKDMDLDLDERSTEDVGELRS